jgi:hypothetical protein
MFDSFGILTTCKTWDCFNSFALWISAIGMVTVSSISLWLAIKDKLIQIDGSFRLGMIPSDLVSKKFLDREVFILSFVNIGRRKVKINNFKLVIKNGLYKKSYIYLFPQLDESLKLINPQFPIRLDEMEDSSLFFDIDFFSNLNIDNMESLFSKNYLFGWYQIYTACFVLQTSIGKDIKIKIHKDSRQKLLSQYKKISNHES